MILLTSYHRAPNANGTDSERKRIGFRTRTDWTPNTNGTNLRLFTYNIIVNLLNGDVVAGLQCAF